MLSFLRIVLDAFVRPALAAVFAMAMLASMPSPAAAQQLVHDINPGSEEPAFASLAAYDGQLHFRADDGTAGLDLSRLQTVSCDFTVTTTNDTGAGSLRQAILDANASAGAEGICFDIAGAGPHTIQPQSALPQISDPVTIDGLTQPGADCSTWPATLQVELNGSQAPTGADGLSVGAGGSGSTIRGLVINRFPRNGIGLFSTETNTIACNYLGTNVAGTAPQANGNDTGGSFLGDGVFLGTSSNNIIGGEAASGVRNLISGNAGSGIAAGSGSAGSVQNRIVGNFIGTNAAGDAAIPNGEFGIRLGNAASTEIGRADRDVGVCNRACNLISGNALSGLLLDAADGVTVQGNFIGTSLDGLSAIGNGFAGINIFTANNQIGGAAAQARNVVSGNALAGILLQTANATGNVIEGNYAGLGPDGETAVPNMASPDGDGDGITINSAPDNVIGGAMPAAGNVLSGNANDGIEILGAGATGNTVQNNRIGTNAAGTAAVPNASDGVDLQDSVANIVADNLASGNTGSGIVIENGSDHVVTGNLIGLDATGTSALGNDQVGVFIGSSSGNQIGGTVAGEGNTISGNGFSGVEIDGGAASGNVVAGNRIGTNAAGTAALGNDEDGVLIDGAPSNTIGGMEAAARNLIAGNGDDGIDVFGSGSFGNRIQHNYIGVDVGGTGVLGNGEDGIDINNEAASTNVYDNVIAANAAIGVLIASGASNNVIARNFIGTNADGDELGNGDDGIRAENSGPQVIGGTYDGTGACCEGNTIAFNGGNGVTIRAVTSVSFEKGILGNRIYQNAGLGIDLQNDGVTPNDAGDSDGSSSANKLQNFPEIASADYDAGTDEIMLTYAVDSDPALSSAGASTYPLRIEFFRVDADGEEGAIFLGTDTYAESDYDGCVASGGAAPCPKTITFAPAGAVTRADQIVATATDASGNTSEFTPTAQPLPVELTAFTATLDEGAVRLAWQTATETNNAGFEVERARDEAAAWERVGFVAGRGTTGEPQTYRFTDAHLPYEAETLAYRLRQVDLDGAFEYSPVVEVALNRPAAFALHAPFPNPAHGTATLRYELRKASDIALVVYNALGQRVSTLKAGAQPAGRHELQAVLRDLPSGVYFVRLTSKEGTRARKLMLVR